jgi:hypothetical protein
MMPELDRAQDKEKMKIPFKVQLLRCYSRAFGAQLLRQEKVSEMIRKLAYMSRRCENQNGRAWRKLVRKRQTKSGEQKTKEQKTKSGEQKKKAISQTAAK